MRILSGIGSRAKRLFLSSSAKEKPSSDGRLSVVAPEFGSKAETFFDSRMWLDSDCDDDFYSVNGEFTPSRGSTPNSQISSPATPRRNIFSDTKSEPSPTDAKKRLFDLLQESFHGEHAHNTQDAETNSDVGSDGTPVGDAIHRRERAGKTKSCCFLGLMPSRGFDDSRKQSPAR